MNSHPDKLRLEVEGAWSVSALLQAPADARACFVLAHGAGAGMEHPFMAAVAGGLGERGIATLRYQFPSMERGTRKPDAPKLAHACVRAAVAQAARSMPDMPLLAGGKSFGGRMTSQAQAAAPLPGVVGLVFLGFPLHPAGKPADARASHLADVTVPMLFLQGTRDALADSMLIEQVVARLGPLAHLTRIDDADHSFHVPSRSGRRDGEVLAAMLDDVARWIDTVVAAR